MSNKKTKKRLAVYIGVTIWLLFVLFPFYWMLNSSLKTYQEMYQLPQTFWPKNPTLENYSKALVSFQFSDAYFNSLLVTSASTLVALVITFPAAYSLTRMRLPYQKTLAQGFLFSYLIPQALLVIPLYILLNSFNLVDTLFGVVLAFVSAAVPYCTWLLMSYFQTIPRELEEAALVDGCSRGQILRYVILPLVRPALVTVAIYAFTMAWDNLLYPLVLLPSSKNIVLPVVLSRFVVGDTTFNWGPMMAAGILTLLLPVAIFVLLQRYVIAGATSGALKG